MSVHNFCSNVNFCLLDIIGIYDMATINRLVYDQKTLRNRTTANPGRPYILYGRMMFFVVISVYLLNYLLDLKENRLVGS